MKAIQFNSFGSSSVLDLVDIDTPKPQEGEVLIKVTAAGVNPVDVKIRKGLLVNRVPTIFPAIPGWDFSGKVVEQGHGAKRFDVGDKVYGYIRRPEIQHGTYAEYIAVPECYLSAAPKSIELKNAAAVPLAALTAYQSLFKVGHLSSQETIVIYGASGGVGSFAIQMAAYKGATTIAIASKKNHSYLKSLGASYTLDYSNGSPVNQIISLFKDGVDFVFDCVGGDAFIDAFKIVKTPGRVVSLLVNQPDANLRPNSNTEYHYWFVEPNTKDLDQISLLIDKKALTVHIEEEFKLNDASIAHDKIDNNHTKGKIIIVVNK